MTAQPASAATILSGSVMGAVPVGQPVPDLPPVVQVFGLAGCQDPKAAPCSMSGCSGFLPAPGIFSRSTLSAAIRECSTATVENSSGE